MSWLRLHSSVVTALVLSGHVAVLTASSAALCFLSSGTTSEIESCPLNLTTDESCSMTQCQMHRSPAQPDFQSDSNKSTYLSHPDHQTVPSSSSDCQLTCGEEELSPLTVLGPPGIFPVPLVPRSLAQVTGLLTSSPSALPEGAVQVSTPPPRHHY